MKKLWVTAFLLINFLILVAVLKTMFMMINFISTWQVCLIFYTFPKDFLEWAKRLTNVFIEGGYNYNRIL